MEPRQESISTSQVRDLSRTPRRPAHAATVVEGENGQVEPFIVNRQRGQGVSGDPSPDRQAGREGGIVAWTRGGVKRNAGIEAGQP